MFIPIPIMIPWLFKEQKEEKQSEDELALYAAKEQRAYKQAVWNRMDYSHVYYYPCGDRVRECYIQKTRMMPRDAVCFVDEGELSYVCTRNIKRTREEAQAVVDFKPETELVIEPWRGGYRMVNKKTGKVKEIK